MLKNVIAAVRTETEFQNALSSGVNIIFNLNPDLLTLKEQTEKAHSCGKKLFIHLDLASGIGKDKSGIIYAKNVGIDGIISTRVNIIKLAREAKLFTVQRFFALDSQSIDTIPEAVKASKPDMIEIMPGLVTKAIAGLKETLSLPIIAGGLIETTAEAENAFSAGAFAISTGKAELWK